MDWKTVHADRSAASSGLNKIRIKLGETGSGLAKVGVDEHAVGSHSPEIGSGVGQTQLDLENIRIGPAKVGLD
jgi:type IV secretory pathway TrbL component